MASEPQALARYLGLFQSLEALVKEVKDRSDEAHLKDLNRLRDLIENAEARQVTAALHASLGRCLHLLLKETLAKNKGELLEVTLLTLCDIVDKIKSRPASLACLVDMVPDVLERVNKVTDLLADRISTFVNLVFEVIPADFDMKELPRVEDRLADLPARSLLHVLCRSEASPDVMERYENLVKENLKMRDGVLACAVLNNWIEGSTSETIFSLMSKFLECLTEALEPREGAVPNHQHENLQFQESQRLQSAVLQIIEKFTIHDARVVLQNLTNKNLKNLARMCKCSEGFKHTQGIVTEMLRGCGEQDIFRLRDSGLVRSLLMSHHDVTQLDQKVVTKVMANCLTPGLAEWLVTGVVVPDIESLLQVHHPCLLRAYLLCFLGAIGSIRNGNVIARLGILLKDILVDQRLIKIQEVEMVTNSIQSVLSKHKTNLES